ncbi:hypothetical protein [Variovorax sp. RCC_210]|uniref:hypothetical protein n=1 Tax=Variovorax sp. RCC_210 TaxID=3239217 RepID=UPI003524D081
MGFVSDLWGGRVKLWRAFWLLGILGGIIWKAFFWLAPLEGWAELIAKFLYIAYFTIVLVGIWRSAFAGNPRNPVLPALARISVVLGFIALAFIVVDVAETVPNRMGSTLPHSAAERGGTRPTQSAKPCGEIDTFLGACNK